MKDHHYTISLRWTGNIGGGTAGYGAYRRDHEIAAPGKPPIAGSSDPAFSGDAARYNPEELLVASLAACHMLWMLHLCAEAGIVVAAYADEAAGEMHMNPDGSGQFTRVVLHPRLTLADAARAAETPSLHKKAHHMCFIARSVNFPVECVPEVEAAAEHL